jgi:peptidylprolyl isomerase
MQIQENQMSQATAGDKVKIHYTGTLEDGKQFDSSEGREPLEFELGSGQVVPGFDKAVMGMAVGESKSVTIAPEDAYGQRNEQAVQEVPKSALPEDLKAEEGMMLQAQNPDGQTVQLAVVSVNDDSITVDANHPLSGKTLNFELSLVEIV